MPNLKTLEGVKRTDAYQIDPRILKVKEGFNPRDLTSQENKEHIEELAISIAAVGVKQPLIISNEEDGIYVVNGHCRLGATMLAIGRGANIITIPCIPEERYASEVDKHYASQITNMGKPLSQLEQGQLYKTLINMGETESAIAKRTGKSAMHINNCLALYAAPEKVKDMVRNGEVSASLATEVVRNDPTPAKTLAEGLETAKASGKGRVTAKHIHPHPEAPEPIREAVHTGPNAGTRLKRAREIFEDALVSVHCVENDDGTTSLTFAREDLEDLKDMLGV
jgi:ParB/RepB/Spo0J family partition protein